jgi:hypothetical protein
VACGAAAGHGPWGDQRRGRGRFARFGGVPSMFDHEGVQVPRPS